MIFVVGLTGCITMGPTTKIPPPDRPRISAKYQTMLMKAGQDIAKEAMRHEWDWHGYADKMENRAGYK